MPVALLEMNRYFICKSRINGCPPGGTSLWSMSSSELFFLILPEAVEGAAATSSTLVLSDHFRIDAHSSKKYLFGLTRKSPSELPCKANACPACSLHLRSIVEVVVAQMVARIFIAQIDMSLHDTILGTSGGTILSTDLSAACSR